MEKNAFRYMWQWSRKYILRYKWHFLWMIVLTLFYVTFNLLQVNFIQRSIDAALVRNWQTMAGMITMFVVLTFVRIIRNYLYDDCINYVDTNVGRDIKNDCASATLLADMQHISTQTSGALVTKLNDDIQTALVFIKDGYANMIVYPLMAVGGFAYLMFFNWKLSIMSFISLPLLSVLLNHMSSRAGRIHLQKLEHRGRLMDVTYDITHGAETIKTYAMQPYMQKKASLVLKEMYDREVEYGLNDAITLSLIMAVGAIPDVIALIYGGMLVMQGEISVSVLFAYAQLTSMVGTPATNVFSTLNAMKKSYQSMQRLDTVLFAPEERRQGESFGMGGENAICFEHVQFGYSPDAVVLKDIHFKLPYGKCIGLAGDSGAGKTSIVNLICGFYHADQGHVSVFGKDITQWKLDALRANIAYISQENYILPGTVFENIQYGKKDAAYNEVMSAAKRAGLLDFINSLALGFDSVLSENGANLSGGQRQRIDLARAFLKDAPVFVFDEPTSALDKDTEAFVMSHFRELTRGKSVIVISHKPSTMAFCDEIYTLTNGRVVKNEIIR